MSLFGKKVENEKYKKIEELYQTIYSWSGEGEELLPIIEECLSLCNSLSDSEAKEFDKNIKKQAKVENRFDKYFRQYVHPIYGTLYDDEQAAEHIASMVNFRKADIKKAIAKQKEFASIVDVTPTINNESVIERNKLSEIPEIKIQNITKSFDKETKLPSFVVIDLETTGLKPASDRIVQVAALRYDHFEPTEVFVSFVNPNKPISEEASKVNGLTDEDVKDAPPFSAIADSLVEFIGKSPIVGFNVSFDLQFLFCSGVDLITKRKIYDAKALAKKVYKGKLDYYSLENVLAYQGVSIKELHDAKVDCYATGMSFLQMIHEITL